MRKRGVDAIKNLAVQTAIEEWTMWTLMDEDGQNACLLSISVHKCPELSIADLYGRYGLLWTGNGQDV